MAQATYPLIAANRNSSNFQDRVTLAVAIYARYLLGLASSNPYNKIAWARNAYQNPQNAATGLFTVIALDPVISDAAVLGNATDAQIQTATETAVNTLFSNFIA